MPIIFSDISLDSKAVGEDDKAYDVNAVRLSLFTIFSTNKGERLFNPNFGSNLESLLFEPMDDTTAFYIRNEILDCITKWEPRIVLNKQGTTVIPNYENQVYEIVLVYSIPLLDMSDSVSFNMSKSK